MFDKFFPDRYVASTYVIDFEGLYKEGVRGLIFDIDNTLLSFNELLVTLKYQPSIAYTTFSHITKGNRYRLLYIFNTPLN